MQFSRTRNRAEKAAIEQVPHQGSEHSHHTARGAAEKAAAHLLLM
jgi:hypothetical protein